jgi:serine/threonine protein kinase/Flp pilus assembly protein TadD
MASPPSSLKQLWDALPTESRGQIPELDALAERLAGELAERWRRGERPLAEEFLARHPELAERPEAAAQLIYEEICQRQECGEEQPSVAVVGRFPQWQTQLELLLDCHHLLRPTPPPRFPAVGQTLGGFRLVAALGRGAVGHVFLAREPFLADRMVVLKVTPCDGEEHLSLARLQHTHIVPLHSVQEYADRNLRALCMPYFGGATLAQVLDRLPARRTGRDLLDALDRAQPAPETLAVADGNTPAVTFRVRGPARQLLGRLSYVQAVCWIGACLADALQYAHERGLVHLDIKPSNVLLAADGTPMLLDFHLAREPIRPGGPVPEWLGGTREYMSPEQQAALAAVGEGRPVTTAVDGRSDVYSLGRVLDEALGGDLPPAARRAPLHRRNPQVSVGLSDLIDKCLASDPAARYPDAASLAADLRRHLGALPLKGVPNRSWRERWQKWRQRRPYGLALAGAVAVAVLALLMGANIVRARLSERQREAEQRVQDAETALAESRDHWQRGEYVAALESARRGRALADEAPDLKQALDQQARRSQRAWRAQQVHEAADTLRFLSGTEPDPTRRDGDGRPIALARESRSIWDRRDELLDRSAGDLDPSAEQRLATDLLDVGLIWSDLQGRLAKTAEEGHENALRVLAEVEARFGPSPVVDRLRQAHAAALGRKDRAAARHADAVAPRTAWEFTALGRSYLTAGDLEHAAGELERAVALRPEDFWANFYEGVCAYRRRRYEDAVTAFRVCAALSPQSPECFFNRALAYDRLGRDERALADYDRALQLNPRLAAAYLNRGLLHYRQKQYADALADLRRALDRGADPATVHYDEALVHLARKDRHAALASVRQALAENPTHKQAKPLAERLQAGR